MKFAFLISFLLSLAAFRSLAEPFVLPPAATISGTAADGKGWQVSGTLSISFVQAQARLRLRLPPRDGRTCTRSIWARTGSLTPGAVVRRN